MNVYKAHMSPAFNRSSAIRHFEGRDAIEIRDGITFDFYMRLPHFVFLIFVVYTNLENDFTARYAAQYNTD